MLLNDFRILPAPPVEAITKREEEIKRIIKDLGHKYLLSRPMPKIIKDKK